jgi:hypothetical protein
MDEFRLDAYVIDTLMRDLVGHDQKPSAFIVYLYLCRRIGAARGGAAHVSHQMIADGTGLSKSAVQDAIRLLVRRELVSSERKAATATPRYSLRRHWRGE